MSVRSDLLKKDKILTGDTGSYRVVEPLGLAGATGEVFRTVHEKSGESFALKVMHPGLSPEMRKRFNDEMTILQRLRGAEDKFGTHHIPRLGECSDLQEAGTQRLFEELGRRPFMFMDYAEGEDVVSLVRDRGALQEADAVEIARQFAEVLYVIHAANFTYTDMKMDNLFWDAAKRHLIVIDWNVVAENRLNDDAPKDRLRAAAYLYEMTTGFPIELRSDAKRGLEVADQSYRRAEAFKNMTVGTRAFLLKAFHPDPASRHGKGGPQVSCTKEFLQDLKRHAARFTMPPEELLKRGESVFKDRLWQEALEDLDVLDRKSLIGLPPEHYGRLQEMLERARQEVTELGRAGFHSGRGRYNNALYAEALDDFEKALKDDPYDEEARLYAILTGLGQRLGEEAFRPIKKSLEACCKAMLEDRLGLAESTLLPLIKLAPEAKEMRSLVAEIAVRKAVRDGKQLVIADKVEEAEKQFHSAYQKRDQILYVELLEENLGDLRKQYEQVEQLKGLYARGDAFFADNKFHESAREFWKAKAVSQGGNLANEKYKKTRAFAAIQELLDARNFDRALEECNRAASFYPKDKKLEQLRTQVIDRKAEQLRSLAASASARWELHIEGEHLKELLKLIPEDDRARSRLEEIKKELAKGYREDLKRLEQALETPSVEVCEAAIRELRDKGFDSIEEVRQFIAKAQKQREEIALMSEKFEALGVKGDIQGQLELLHEAAAKKWTLLRENPKELQIRLGNELLDKQLEIIKISLRVGKPKEAMELCQRYVQHRMPAEKKALFHQLAENARKLVALQERLSMARQQLKEILQDEARPSLPMLKCKWEELACLRQLRQLQPDLEGLEEPSESANRLKDLRTETQNFMAGMQTEAILSLDSDSMQRAWQINRQMNEAAAFLSDAEVEAKDIGEKGKVWGREFVRLIDWVERSLPALRHKDIAAIAESLAKVTEEGESQTVLQQLSRLEDITENFALKAKAGESPTVLLQPPTPEEKAISSYQAYLERLKSISAPPSVAAWLIHYLERELERAEIWQALGSGVVRAQDLISRPAADNEYTRYEAAREVVEQVNTFLENEANGTEKNLPKLQSQLEEAEKLKNDLQKFSRLRGSRCANRLDERTAVLQQTLAECKQKLILDYAVEVDELLKKLEATGADHQARFNLEIEAGAKIEILHDLDPDPMQAREYENRLQKILQALARPPAVDVSKYENFRRLAELQLRVLEKCQENKDATWKAALKSFEHDPNFRPLTSMLDKFHEDMLYEKKREKSRQNTGERLKFLLELRERYGEFPELASSIAQASEEIAQRKPQEHFAKITATFHQEKGKVDWQGLADALRQVPPGLLLEPQQKKYLEIKTETERYLLLLRPFPEKDLKADLEEYLKNGVVNKGKQWIEALSWALDNNFPRELLNRQIKQNLESCLKVLLKHPLKKNTLGAIHHLKHLQKQLEGLDMQNEDKLRPRKNSKVAK